MKENHTIAIIPARSGSKRLPNKNTLEFGEAPLIYHSIKYALENSDIIHDVYVSTNCPFIKKIARNYNVKIIDRPEKLSGDQEPTVTALEHVLSTINNKVDAVVLLQPTNPLRPKNLLKAALEIFYNQKTDSLFTVSPLNKKLGKIHHKTFTPFNYQIGQRSQDLEELYYENGLLYISKPHMIKRGIIFNEESYPLIVKHKYATVDIDTKEDFEYAKYILLNSNED